MATLAIVLAILTVAVMGQEGFGSSYMDDLFAFMLLVAALACGISVAVMG